MTFSKKMNIKLLRAIETLYAFSIIGIWAYFEINKNKDLLLYMVPGFFIFVPLIICLLLTDVKYKWYIGSGLLLIIIAGTGIHAIITVGTPWVIFATFYSVFPFVFVLFTWIGRKWTWFVFVIFHSLIMVSALVYVLIEMNTGIVDVVFCGIILSVLFLKNTREYFRIKSN